MEIVIVPNYVAELINKKLDEAFMLCPCAAKERESLFQQLLCHYDEYGEVPYFIITEKVR